MLFRSLWNTLAEIARPRQARRGGRPRPAARRRLPRRLNVERLDERVCPSTAVAKLVLAGFPTPAAVGTAGNFTVTAEDSTGHTVTNYSGTVHFTSSDSKAGLPGDYTFVSADHGTHTFSATFETAGSESLTATDKATHTLTGSQTGIVVDLAATRAATLAVAGFASPTDAGTPGTFTVTAQDAGGHVVTGYAGTVHFTSSDAAAALPHNYTFVAADHGTHTFSATLNTVGTQSLTATDTATHTITGGQSGIVVNPAPTTATALSVTGYPTPVTAGTPGTFTVTATDGHGHVVTGYAGTIHFTSGDSKAVLPPDYTFVAADHGSHTFSATFNTTGTQSLAANDKATPTITGNQAGIVVNPAAAVATRFVVTGYPTPATEGTPGTFTVTAEDATGHVVTDYTGTVHFTSSDSKAGLPHDYTFVAANHGTHTFSATFNTSGAQSLTVTDMAPHGITGSQAGIQVNAVTGHAPTITGLSKSVVLPGSAAFTLSITGTGFTHTSVVHFDGSPLTTTFVSDTELQVTIPASALATAGTHQVRVVNPDAGGGRSNIETLTVTAPALVPGSPLSLTVTDGHLQLRGADVGGGQRRVAQVNHRRGQEARAGEGKGEGRAAGRYHPVAERGQGRRGVGRGVDLDAGLAAGDARRGLVGGRQRLGAGRVEGGAEGVRAVVGGQEGIVVRQHGLSVTAGEVDGAGVAGDVVPVAVFRRHRERARRAGRDRRRVAADHERGGRSRRGVNHDAALTARNRVRGRSVRRPLHRRRHRAGRP
jgi:hypothetical protein